MKTIRIRVHGQMHTSIGNTVCELLCSKEMHLLSFLDPSLLLAQYYYWANKEHFVREI